jgi:hypothetical protein
VEATTNYSQWEEKAGLLERSVELSAVSLLAYLLRVAEGEGLSDGKIGANYFSINAQSFD